MLSCDISEHLCGESCAFLGKRGCLERCSKVRATESTSDFSRVTIAIDSDCKPRGPRSLLSRQMAWMYRGNAIKRSLHRAVTLTLMNSDSHACCRISNCTMGRSTPATNCVSFPGVAHDPTFDMNIAHLTPISNSNEPHEMHYCQIVSCPIRCQLCKRLCASGEHLHGLDPTVEHLCGYV